MKILSFRPVRLALVICGVGGGLLACASSVNYNRMKLQDRGLTNGESHRADTPVMPNPMPQPVGHLLIDPTIVVRRPHLEPFMGQFGLATATTEFVFPGPDEEPALLDRQESLNLVRAAFNPSNQNIMTGRPGKGPKNAGKIWLASRAMPDILLDVECANRCPGGLELRLSGPYLQNQTPGGIYRVIGSNSSRSIGRDVSLDVSLVERQEHKIAEIEFLPSGKHGLSLVVSTFDNLWRATPRIRLYLSPSARLEVREKSLKASEIKDGADGRQPDKMAYVQVLDPGDAGDGCLLSPANSADMFREVFAGSGTGISVTRGPAMVIRARERNKPFGAEIFCGRPAVLEGFSNAVGRVLDLPAAISPVNMGEPASTRSEVEANAVLVNEKQEPLLTISSPLNDAARISGLLGSMAASWQLVVSGSSGRSFLNRLQKAVGKSIKVSGQNLATVSFYGRPVAGLFDNDHIVANRGNSKLESTIEPDRLAIPDVMVLSAIGQGSEIRNLLMKHSTNGQSTTHRLVQGDKGMAMTVRQWPLQLQLVEGSYEAYFFKSRRGLICRVPLTVFSRESGVMSGPVACEKAQEEVKPDAQIENAPIVDASPEPINRVWSESKSGQHPAVTSERLIRNRRLGVSFQLKADPEPVLVEILRELGSPSAIRVDPSRRKIPTRNAVVGLPCGTGIRLLQNIRATALVHSQVKFSVPVHGCPSRRSHPMPWSRIIDALRLGLKSEGAIVDTSDQDEIGLVDLVYPFENESEDVEVLSFDGSRYSAPGRSGFFVSLAVMQDAEKGKNGKKKNQKNLVARIRKKPFGHGSDHKDFDHLKLRLIVENRMVKEVALTSDLDLQTVTLAIDQSWSRSAVRAELVAELSESLAKILGVPGFMTVAESQVIELI